MKSIVIGIVVCMVMVSLAQAGMPEDNCGCGLGSIAFKGKDGLVFQVLAATTNGCLGNQTFGISSGTLECKKAPSFASNEQLNKFVADNMDNLAKDIAIGQGESLDTLAELIGVSTEKRPNFYATLQTNFSNIFPSEGVSPVDVLENIARVIEKG
jgi:hypothetical protein